MTKSDIFVLLFALFMAGCAGIGSAPQRDQPVIGATQGRDGAVESPVANAPATPPATPELIVHEEPPAPAATSKEAVPAQPEPATATASFPGKTPAQATAPSPKAAGIQETESTLPPSTATKKPHVAAGKTVATTELPATKPPLKKPPEPTRADVDQKQKAAALVPAKPKAPALDLKSLETRLRNTDAIGTFTKLALKNQVDDLLDQFRAYYQGQSQTTLAQLRKPYEQLILKVRSLLMEGDPKLADAIMASREAIWTVLSDPAKFAKL